MNFSKQSKQLTKELSKEDKKNNGIYFTPPSIIAKMMNILFPYFKNITNVLNLLVVLVSLYKGLNVLPNLI